MTFQNPEAFARYQRQMILPGFGPDAQRAMSEGHAVVIGCGALGCVVADWLCRAGVGRLTIIDRDTVELGNLHRQTLFDEQDAREGTPKAIAAQQRLHRVNSGVRIDAGVHDVNAQTVERLLPHEGGRTVVLDATDNFQTRYLLNDVCVKLGLPLVYAGVVGTNGMVLPILPGESPCLRCVFPEPPAPGLTPTCETAGVLGPAVGVIGSLQAAEGIKLLAGRREAASGSLYWIDLWRNAHREIDVSGADRASCPCCGRREFEFLHGPRAAGGTAALCGANSVQVHGSGAGMDLDGLLERLRAHGSFTRTRHLLKGTLRTESGAEMDLTVFPDGRAIIGGTSDPLVARTIYDRYIGS